MADQSPTTAPKLDDWKHRRRAVFGYLVFAAVVVGWLALRGTNDELRRDIAGGLILASAGVLVAYIAGRVAEGWRPVR